MRARSVIFSQLRDAGFLVDMVGEPHRERAGQTSNPEEMRILQTQPFFGSSGPYAHRPYFPGEPDEAP